MKLRCENLVKKYGVRTVVKGVSMEVEQGEIVGFLGPNGAGKTTSFYMITGQIVPNGGRIFLDEATDRFYVCVGHWLNDIDQEHFREVLEDEFNLPEDFDLVVDIHWDLGHGWSEEFL